MSGVGSSAAIRSWAFPQADDNAKLTYKLEAAECAHYERGHPMQAPDFDFRDTSQLDYTHST